MGRKQKGFVANGSTAPGQGRTEFEAFERVYREKAVAVGKSVTFDDLVPMMMEAILTLEDAGLELTAID